MIKNIKNKIWIICIMLTNHIYVKNKPKLYYTIKTLTLYSLTVG